MGFSSLKNVNTGGGTYENPPAGSHLARCYYIVDQGYQETNYQGETKVSHKVRIGWELPAETMSDGRPFAIFENFTASLNEKAKLFSILKAWLGKAPDPETFDMKSLIGKEAMVSIIHNERGDKVYANLSSVMPVPKGMPVPKAINDPIFFDFDNPDKGVFDKLSPKTQEILRKAQDWADCSAKMSPYPDSDIPF